MTNRRSLLTVLAGALAFGLTGAAPTATPRDASPTPVTLVSARVSLAGTSNVHPYTASTTTVRLVRMQLAAGVAGANLWDAIVKPGAIEAFEIAVPAATLASDREGLDKNMHKALKVAEHADITFRLSALEPAAAAGAMHAKGTLTIAGVERDVTLELAIARTEPTLTITGTVPLVMTDFGITPPKAMLGMLKTDPKVTVTFETVLGIPLT